MSQPFDAGIALFDNPDFPQTSSGFSASKDGCRRFASAADLSSGTTWWTNVNYSTFSSSRLWQRGNMRNDQMLRMTMGQVIHELGLSFLPPAQQADALLNVLVEAVQFTHTNYLSCVTPFQRLDWHLGDALRNSRRLQSSSPVLVAARAAHAYMSPAMQASSSSRESRTYCAPRTPRLLQMLNLPVPAIDADWSFTPHNKRVNSSAELWDLVGPAGLVEIDVSNTDENVGLVAPFGAVVRASAATRSWTALPEAMFYADHSDLTVKGFWRASKVSPARDYLRVEPINNEFSFSAALVSESLMYALMGLPSLKSAPTGREPMAAYMAAYDRMQMISVALKLYEAGYNPLSCSCGGRIVVSASQSLFAEIDGVCAGLGLESPMSGV